MEIGQVSRHFRQPPLVEWAANVTRYFQSLGNLAVDNGLLSSTYTIDFASIAAGGTATSVQTLTGAKVGATCVLGLPAAPSAGIVFDAYVSAADQVTVRAQNLTGGAIDPASATYRVTVINHE